MNLGRLEQAALTATERIRDLETKVGELKARLAAVEQARPARVEHTKLEEIAEHLEEAVPASTPVPVEPTPTGEIS